MEKKIFKTIIAIMLIITLAISDVLLLGYNVVQAISTTNIEKVEFDVSCNNETSIIQNGDTLILKIAVKESGLLKDAKIKIENANFKIESIENQYVKSVNTSTNEIELNQFIAGNELQIEVPIKFDSEQNITKDYLSQVANVKLSGTYKDGEKTTKVEASRELHINWKEEEQITIEQAIDKWVKITENQTLIEQSINAQIINNALVKGKQLEISVPEIQNTLPEKIDLLINGNKANEENYTYNKENKIVTINMPTKEAEIYKIIYYYPQNLEAQQVTLNTKLQVQLYTEETIDKEDIKEVEAQAIGYAVSTKEQVTGEMYKGYLYANVENATSYQENMQIEISSLEKTSNIRIDGIIANFLDESGRKYNVTGSTFIRKVTLNKNNLQTILGEEFEVKLGEKVVNKDSDWNENNEIEISLEEEDLATMIIQISEPKQIGTININMEKYIKGTTGYEKNQLKTFTKLENQSTISIEDVRIVSSSESELKDTITEASLQLSTTKFSSTNTNENVQITATLKSDSNKYDLFKNPYIEIRFPEELEEIKVNSINGVYSDEFNFEKTIYMPATKSIILQLRGEQTAFRTTVEQGIQIAISADLTFTKNTASKDVAITMIYTNENGNEEQYQTQANANINTKYGGILYSNLEGYNAAETKVDTIEEDIKGTLDLKAPARQATINQTFINNYDNELNEINILGSVKGENTTIQNIAASGENVKVYYSEEENATEGANTWQETPTANAKSYKITKQGALAKAEKINLAFNLNIPENMQAGENILQTTQVDYIYNEQKLNTTTNIALEAPSVKVSESNGITTEVSAESAETALQEGDEVYEEQAIRYTVKIINNTGSDLNNFQLVAEHTNVVYYAVLQEDARDPEVGKGWTPDQDPIMETTIRDENAENVTKTQDIIKNGETAIFKYDISPKKKNGDQITGNIKIKADELPEQTIQTITTKIKDAELSIRQINQLDEKVVLKDETAFPVRFIISNYTDKELKDVIVKVKTSRELQIAGPETEKIDGKYENVGQEITLSDDIIVSIEEITNNMLTLKIKSLKGNKRANFIWGFYSRINFGSTTEPIYSTGRITSSVTYNDTTYASNIIERKLERKTPEVTARQTVEIQRKETDNNMLTSNVVSIGDKLIYTADITNKDAVLGTEGYLDHTVTLSNGKITKAYIKNEKGETTNAEIITTGYARANYTLNPAETLQYIAEVEVWSNPDEEVNYKETIESEMNLTWKNYGSYLISPISLNMDGELEDGNPDVEISEEDPNDEDYNGENTNPNKNKPGTPGGNTGGVNDGTGEKYSISGITWLDKNKNSVRESQESGLANFEVKLVNTSNGQTVQSTTTKNDGTYIFNNIGKGTYIAMFMYNSSKYSITGYHKEGASDTENSDVIQKTINNIVVAATDNLVITDKNITNIDAGFTENEKFDLKLDKSITKVTVKNTQGTQVTEFNKAKLAKIDIHAKQLANSQVTVEYLIEVTNEGEIAGYATDVIDYMPNDLSFNKEQNQGWYVGNQDNNLHNVTLEKTLIQPGETKQLILVLTKQMTENNTGTSANIAEIGGITNELSAKDIDSTPGNRKDGEDDISTAELLVSVKTGLVVYVSVFTIIVALIGVAFILYRKKGGIDNG